MDQPAETKEVVMTRWFSCVLLICVLFGAIGCESSGHDDSGAAGPVQIDSD
jgi:hypothetical protein